MAKKYIRLRHKFYFKVLRPIGLMLCKKFNFKCKPKKFNKGEQYLILSNHQTVLDPVFVAYSFKAPVFIVASDTLFNKSFISRLLVHLFAPIKKRKAEVDISCIRTCNQIAKEGGNILIFPEGNRSWADGIGFIDPSICKLVRMLKLPLMLYTLNGGYGINPRWGNKRRKGKFYGNIQKIISVEEIKSLSDDQLFEIIIKNLCITDNQNGFEYKSSRGAEYLERLLFVCPICGKTCTLSSHGKKLTCSHCKSNFSYSKNLRLASDNDNFNFATISDWYKYQQTFAQNYIPIKNKSIFYDQNIELFDKTNLKRKKLGCGDILLTDKVLLINKMLIPISDITSATVVGGIKLVINTKTNSYIIKGHKRFNAVKYVFFINKLAGLSDNYYGLTI